MPDPARTIDYEGSTPPHPRPAYFTNMRADAQQQKPNQRKQDTNKTKARQRQTGLKAAVDTDPWEGESEEAPSCAGFAGGEGTIASFAMPLARLRGKVGLPTGLCSGLYPCNSGDALVVGVEVEVVLGVKVAFAEEYSLAWRILREAW